jgi:plastocyanin
MLSRLRKLVLYCGTGGMLAGLLVACGNAGAAKGDTGDFSAEIAAQQVVVAANPRGALRWDRASYEATAGDITFVVTNMSPVAHQFSIEGNSVTFKSPNFGANTTHNYTVNGLPAGKYRIVCNYPGHKAAGMMSALIVR